MDAFIKNSETQANKLIDAYRENLASEISKTGFPQDVTCNGSDESVAKIKEWLSGFNPPQKVKKTTPKKGKEINEDLWIDPVKYLEFVEEQKGKENPQVMCPWYCKKGDPRKVGKTCGEIITDGSYTENSFLVRCKDCKRNNKPNSTARLEAFYKSLEIGKEVNGSPTGGFNKPAEDLTGIKDGVTSPTPGPKDFLEGNGDGVPSPSKAKGKKKKSPKGLSLKLLSKYGKTEEHWDCYNKNLTNGFNLLVRKNLETGTFVVGGKFPEGYENFDNENYLSHLEKLSEEDLEIVKKAEVDYDFLGTEDSAGSKEDLEPEEESDQEEDDDMDALLMTINEN